jgi:hypothetical protein
MKRGPVTQKSLVELAGFDPALWSGNTVRIIDDYIRDFAPTFIVSLAERRQWGGLLRWFGIMAVQSNPERQFQFIGVYRRRECATLHGEV